MIEEAELEGSLGLCVAVMYERSLGSDSPWDGYLQVLPERESVPLVWSLEEADSLLSGTELDKVVKEDKACLCEDWKEHIEPLILSESFKLDPSYFGVEQYFSAKSLVSSRSFEIDDYHGYGMVPLADLFNHKTAAENVHFTTQNSSSSSDDEDDGDISQISDDEKSVVETLSSSPSGNSGDNFTNSGDDPNNLEMIVVREVQAGAEVFNTYGIMGNAALLHRYGFTEPDNTFDIVNIDLNLVLKHCSSSFSSRYIRSRVSLWRRLNYSGCTSENSEYFEISFNGEPQIELIVLVYIVFLPEYAYEKLNCMVDFFVEAIDSTNLIKLINITRNNCSIGAEKINELLLTRDVRNALKSLADMRETFYGPNTLEDDESRLRIRSSVKDRKLYHSLVLRVCERRILSRLRVYASGGYKTKKRKV
ncbi:uncharacterized protein A4U43_UnF8680 [Asparagus officinalis]|uniref:Uncharacterized protein n=2 Tax=Asparagus officinalis TaxID=4686 RepID=A0A1R3L5X9_ASPOF|nr:uncharacterized protein A4U43_UnF8680 [Asparagus officinalis]